MATFVLTPGQGGPGRLSSYNSNPVNEAAYAQALVNACARVIPPDSTPLTVVFTFDDSAHTLTISGIS